MSYFKNIIIKDADTSTTANVGTNGLEVEVKKSALPVSGVSIDDIYKVLQDIRDASYPNTRPDFNESSNALNCLPVGGTVSTVTTVNTVANQTSMGGFSTDMLTENAYFQDWALSVRSLLE